MRVVDGIGVLYSMTEHQSGVPRLYIAAALSANAEATLNRAQIHYLIDVLRLKPGDPVRVFNPIQPSGSPTS